LVDSIRNGEIDLGSDEFAARLSSSFDDLSTAAMRTEQLTAIFKGVKGVVDLARLRKDVVEFATDFDAVEAALMAEKEMEPDEFDKYKEEKGQEGYREEVLSKHSEMMTAKVAAYDKERVKYNDEVLGDVERLTSEVDGQKSTQHNFLMHLITGLLQMFGFSTASKLNTPMAALEAAKLEVAEMDLTVQSQKSAALLDDRDYGHYPVYNIGTSAAAFLWDPTQTDFLVEIYEKVSFICEGAETGRPGEAMGHIEAAASREDVLKIAEGMKGVSRVMATVCEKCEVEGYGIPSGGAVDTAMQRFEEAKVALAEKAVEYGISAAELKIPNLHGDMTVVNPISAAVESPEMDDRAARVAAMQEGKTLGALMRGEGLSGTVEEVDEQGHGKGKGGGRGH